MRRVERFWEWEADVWQGRAEAYNPEKAEKFEVSPSTALFPQLVERMRAERKVLFQGKAAYALRQAHIRRTLKKRAHLRFAQHILVLDGGEYREIREFTPGRELRVLTPGSGL